MLFSLLNVRVSWRGTMPHVLLCAGFPSGEACRVPARNSSARARPLRTCTRSVFFFRPRVVDIGGLYNIESTELLISHSITVTNPIRSQSCPLSIGKTYVTYARNGNSLNKGEKWQKTRRLDTHQSENGENKGWMNGSNVVHMMRLRLNEPSTAGTPSSPCSWSGSCGRKSIGISGLGKVYLQVFACKRYIFGPDV